MCRLLTHREYPMAAAMLGTPAMRMCRSGRRNGCQVEQRNSGTRKWIGPLRQPLDKKRTIQADGSHSAADEMHLQDNLGGCLTNQQYLTSDRAIGVRVARSK